MLNCLGIRALENLIKFLARWQIETRCISLTAMLGSNTLWEGLGSAVVCGACTMCVAAALAKQ